MKRVVHHSLDSSRALAIIKAEVLRSPKECRTGVELFPEFAQPDIPVKLAGTIKGFQFPTPYFEDWSHRRVSTQP